MELFELFAIQEIAFNEKHQRDRLQQHIFSLKDQKNKNVQIILIAPITKSICVVFFEDPKFKGI